MISWLLKTALGRAVGLTLAGMLASGVLFAGCQIRGCMKMKQELRDYHQADRVRAKDKKIDKQTQESQDEVEGYTTDDDFMRGFDRLRNYGADE